MSYLVLVDEASVIIIKEEEILNILVRQQLYLEEFSCILVHFEVQWSIESGIDHLQFSCAWLGNGKSYLFVGKYSSSCLSKKPEVLFNNCSWVVPDLGLSERSSVDNFTWSQELQVEG